jgi:hypothetical protein
VTPTLRRLNDRERYWGLTWPEWIAAAAAGGVLYAAVRLSPFGFKPTVTIVALLIALFAMVLLGVSGQALSPARQLQAIARYRRSAKRWEFPAKPDGHGLVLAAVPERVSKDSDIVEGLDDQWDADDLPVGQKAEWFLDQAAKGALE